MKLLIHLQTWSLGMNKKFHPKLYHGNDYLSMRGLKLTMLEKGASELQIFKAVRSIWNSTAPRHIIAVELSDLKWFKVILVNIFTQNIVLSRQFLKRGSKVCLYADRAPIHHQTSNTQWSIKESEKLCWALIDCVYKVLHHCYQVA